MSKFDVLPAGKYTVMCRVRVAEESYKYVKFSASFSRPARGSCRSSYSNGVGGGDENVAIGREDLQEEQV